MSLGFGGAGLSRPVVVEETSRTVSRSEGPGTFSATLEYALSEQIGVGVDHSRGFRLSPFSSGLSLTGATLRWYPLHAPQRIGEVRDQSYFFLKRVAYFVGASSGVISGTVKRTGDQVETLEGSGVYGGIQLGADYPWVPGTDFRVQVSSCTTLMSSAQEPASLLYFSISAGFLFRL
jgi:hypothetical protein